MDKKALKREILITADGSTTIHLPEWNEQYHSKHGAIQEAYHVFIKNGLDLFTKEVAVLEIGFGTGLNAFISLLEAQKRNLSIDYVGVEAFPILDEEVAMLNYPLELQATPTEAASFYKLHEVSWEEKHTITKAFSLLKRKQFFEDITDKVTFDLIYFDAFGARVQPDLWTENIFQKMYEALKPKGYLLTYSAKGSVRRAMQAVGFEVERLEGPPGKREMLRARKV